MSNILPLISHASNTPCPQSVIAGVDAVKITPGLTFWLDTADESILSLAVAIDLRGDCVVALVDNQGHTHQFDASYASHAQRLRVHLLAGVRELRVTKITGDAELWIAKQSPLAPELVHTAADLTTRRQRALALLRHHSVCQFSWMGGCVLDGLWQLHQHEPNDGWNTALENWLQHFRRVDDLVYQSPRGNEVCNDFHGIESTLPVAIIALHDPQSPVINYAIENWQRLTKPDGTITDHSVTAEGSYTAAYPMAVIGKLRNESALVEAALTQLSIRRDKLCIDGDLYLRNLDGALSFRNWTRGICWSLLGLARTLETLGPDADSGLAAFATERSQWIISRQRDDGLWDNFLDEAAQGSPPDSSGSSGIATALLIFHQLGLIDNEALNAARRCWDGLGYCLEPDGWLGSVAPNNKRGEAEQHTHRRTIEPFALGLYGQLAAALPEAL